ncbi:MAG: phosphoribulokinase [Methylocystis sp.]|nr:phosphoribulokinase [Methylocystis sp.]
MSIKHPIISITGSSGAGTSSVKQTFEQIFRREKVEVAYIEGDSFHRYDRNDMEIAIAKAHAEGNTHFSHFGPEANLLAELEALFKQYSEDGTGSYRHYVHDDDEAAIYGTPPGSFTPWEDVPANTDLLFYEGLHGAVVTDEVNVARYADLKIGVVPVINLEWTQKLHRDRISRGYTTEAVTETILRRMHNYVHYICPQFSETDINFQRAPTVDTSNPFVARSIPTPDESILVIRFRDPHGVDFPYLVAMIAGSWMSRANSIVIPGNKLDIAMQLLLTPRILDLIKLKKSAA